ncbi:hypothetical protein Tpen_1341 [Thermofilum pendens Hrk 5]|uniref:Uncharacterized protein n=1 Tax=Thermofilum pendens (strain DSM 2475 / Hrk 5) TaxID=368408 RepID=A1RZV8_THEPD|nr:hypothetical protein Tpen_1341 [Thermofilum pendens Hrk 5]
MLPREVEERVREVCGELRRRGFDCDVSPEEFAAYMEADTYTGDRAGLWGVVGNRYLLIHELAEISALKRMGYRVDRGVLRRAYPDSYRAHLEAMDVELRVAAEEGDLGWVEARLRDLAGYLSDPLLPEGLAEEVGRLLRKYSGYVR